MKLFTDYLEAKETLINKLNWTDEQKKQIQELVNKYPQKASKIDWNQKDLTFNSVLSTLQETSKKDIKTGNISGLKLGIDYLDLSTEEYTAYVPLSYPAARVIANKKVGGVEGKWCITDQNTREHWDSYVNNIPILDEDELIQMYQAEKDANTDFESDEDYEAMNTFDREDFDNWLLEHWDEILSNYAAYRGAFVVFIVPGKISSSGAAYDLETNKKTREFKFNVGDMHKLAVYADADQFYSRSVGIWDEKDDKWEENDFEIHTGIDIDKIKIPWKEIRNKITKHTDYLAALKKARAQGLPV